MSMKASLLGRAIEAPRAAAPRWIPSRGSLRVQRTALSVLAYQPDPSHSDKSNKGKTFENKNRRRGRPASERREDDSPMRDGNRDRLIGLLTERSAKTLLVYLQETNMNVFHWLMNYMIENPIPKNGSWDDMSGETFLRQLLSMPVGMTKLANREALYDHTESTGVDPRQIAQRIMDIRSQLALEFIQDLTGIKEENNDMMRETLESSLAKMIAGMGESQDYVPHPEMQGEASTSEDTASSSTAAALKNTPAEASAIVVVKSEEETSEPVIPAVSKAEDEPAGPPALVVAKAEDEAAVPPALSVAKAEDEPDVPVVAQSEDKAAEVAVPVVAQSEDKAAEVAIPVVAKAEDEDAEPAAPAVAKAEDTAAPVMPAAVPVQASSATPVLKPTAEKEVAMQQPMLPTWKPTPVQQIKPGPYMPAPIHAHQLPQIVSKLNDEGKPQC